MMKVGHRFLALIKQPASGSWSSSPTCPLCVKQEPLHRDMGTSSRLAGTMAGIKQPPQCCFPLVALIITIITTATATDTSTSVIRKMTKKIITVFGATGAQGGSVAKIFLTDPKLKDDWTVRAVTRDATKESSKKLAAAGAEVVTVSLLSSKSTVFMSRHPRLTVLGRRTRTTKRRWSRPSRAPMPSLP